MTRESKAILWEVRKATGSLHPLTLETHVYATDLCRSLRLSYTGVRPHMKRLGFDYHDGYWTRDKPSLFKRIVWWMQDYQPATWAGHVALTALAPVFVSFFVPTWIAPPFVAASFVAGYFGVREWLDYEAKRKAGTLRRADAQGITGIVDGMVDWGGPLAVAFTYALAELL